MARDLLEQTPFVVFRGVPGDIRAWTLMDGRDAVFVSFVTTAPVRCHILRRIVMTKAGTETFVRQQYSMAVARMRELGKPLFSTEAARERAFDAGLAISLAACAFTDGRGMTEDQAADAILLGLRAAVKELEWPQEVVAIVQDKLRVWS